MKPNYKQFIIAAIQCAYARSKPVELIDMFGLFKEFDALRREEPIPVLSSDEEWGSWNKSMNDFFEKIVDFVEEAIKKVEASDI